MRAPFSSLLAILAILSAGCGTPGKPASPATLTAPLPSLTATGQEITDAETGWLKTNAVPFDTVEPSSVVQDLLPLKGIIGNARIVALGEATHGTHEFFQMKTRILEFLVQEMGFNTFAIEAGWPEANRINEYVHGGEGDPAALLKGLYFWTWDTQEVLDLIQWMRAYNENPIHPRKISFYGFDMQYDQLAEDTVTQYVRQVDPSAENQIAEDYLCLPVECQEKFQEVFDWLSQHQAVYSARSSAEEFNQALHSARIVVQSSDYSNHGNDYSLRDRYMAENITWIMDQAGPDAKIVLWAHNAHVGLVSLPGAQETMGSYLRNEYGSQMVVFGFLFYQGSFNAYLLPRAAQLHVFQVGPPAGDSYEYFLHSAGIPLFFLDLRTVSPDSTAAGWLLAPHPFRMVGCCYDPNNPWILTTMSLAKEFDAVIYIQDTSPSELLEP